MMSAPHPLAAALVERLHSRPTSRVLDFAAGSGRNTGALRAAGFAVVAIGDAAAASEMPFAGVEGGFDAVISTHGLLHGTRATVASRLRTIADRLEPGGLLYASLGSIRDARFGCGERLDDSSFAPTDGDERGVAHAYFERDEIGRLLERDFLIESLDERNVDQIAGRWAHRENPLHRAVHWFVRARKR
jgi:SAM-dependent methyltransferase